MTYKTLAWLMLLVVADLGYVRAASAHQFNFSDLENYQTSGDAGQQEAQLDRHALEYIKGYFPAGSSAARAIFELSQAGAKCSIGDDFNDPPGYICIWTRPGHGLSYFVVQIEWIIGINTDFNHKIVQGVSVERGENSL